MKNIVKKSLVIVFILLTVLSCFSGCVDDSLFHFHDFQQKFNESKHFKECSCGKIKNIDDHTFNWKSNYKHKECTACGYIIKQNTPIEIEKNEDGTVKLKEELISALSFHLNTFGTQADKVSSYNILCDKLTLSKSDDYNPLFVKFGNECYYVAAYYTAIHEYADEAVSFCCDKEYIWVGFENAEDIKESWAGEKLVVAFQINPQEFCVNLKTDSNDVIMDYFTLYKPGFVDGTALAPVINCEKLFIYITNEEDKYVCCPSNGWYRDPSIACIEIEGNYYVKELSSSKWNDGAYINYPDRPVIYGEYFDQLMEIAYGIYAVNDGKKTTNYTLFKVEDIAKIIKRS